MSRCKSCGAEIIWITMRSGKSMPCDAKPITYRATVPGGPERTLTLVRPDGRIATGVFDPDADEKGYTSHFATCPNANQHRRRGK